MLLAVQYLQTVAAFYTYAVTTEASNTPCSKKTTAALLFLQYLWAELNYDHITENIQSSCARGDTICPRLARCGPPPVHSLHALCLRRLTLWIFGGVETGVVHINYVMTWTANQRGLVTMTFDLKSGVPVTCDVCYLCANFGLPGPLCSWLRPNVRDRQTSDKSIA